MNKSLSNLDIKKALNNDVNIITYEHLTTYNNIDSLFGGKKYIVLLFETTDDYGHWTCIIRRGKTNIEFFDSYGLVFDDELKFSDRVFRKDKNMLFPHLTYLLLKCNYNVEFNNYQFQKKGRNITTCGRWCIVRCLLNDMNIDEFARMFYHPKSDEIITKLTYDI